MSDGEEMLVSSVAGPPHLQVQPLSQGSKRNSPTCCPAAPEPSLSGTAVRAARRRDAPIDGLKITNTLHIMALT